MVEKKLSGSKVLMVIAPEQFRDEELLVPQKIFLDAGARVVVACSRTSEANGMLGAKLSPDVEIKNVKAKDYDAVVVVGGMGSPQYLWADTDLHKILQDMQSKDKVVSGICLSGAVLAQSGVLKGKRATVWPTSESLKALADGGANYCKDHVVHDGKVITADGPESAVEFGQAIVYELSKIASKA